MANLRRLFAVVLASVFLSANISVHSLPTKDYGAGFGEERQNSSIIVEESKEIIQPNETNSGVVTGLGFPCDSKTCIMLCCPPGKAQLEKTCVDDNVNSSVWSQIGESVKNAVGRDKPEQNFHLLIDDPCAIDWMAFSVSENFSFLPDGSIYALDYDGEGLFDFEHHCLFRNPESEVYLAKVCRPWIIKVYWQIICLLFNSVVMLAIFIGYSVVPELRNLHGMVFRAYVATYILVNLAVVGQQFTVDTRRFPGLFTFFVFGLHYTAGCCALWLNVMSFNIWRTFRGLRSFESTTREQDRKKFICYAMYAYVTPGVINISTMFIMCYVPYFRKISLGQNLILWTCAGLLSSIVICNGFFFASTALRIRKHKKDTAQLAKGVNKHHEVEKQWFNLHLKLFMITGAHTIMWVIWELWPTEISTNLMIVVEVIQTVLIFIIFIWKDNVKRSIHKRFDDTMYRLQSTFGTTNTPAATRK